MILLLKASPDPSADVTLAKSSESFARTLVSTSTSSCPPPFGFSVTDTISTLLTGAEAALATAAVYLTCCASNCTLLYGIVRVKSMKYGESDGASDTIRVDVEALVAVVPPDEVVGN